MDRPPPRTLLEQLIRRSRRTIEETCVGFERTASEHGEKATLSPRQLARWMAGNVGAARPVAQRTAFLHWGFDFEQLIGPARDGAELALPMGLSPLPQAGMPTPHAWTSVGTDRDIADWPAWFGVRLGHLVGTVDNWAGPRAESDALQTLLNKEILMFDAAGEKSDPVYALSRRQALVTVAALPLTLASPTTGTFNVRAAAEFFLSRCAASLAACWHLLRGSDLQTVAQVLSTYMFELEALANRESAQGRAAARLASQAHRICGIIALHRNQLNMREHHCKQALQYANADSDASSRASALISLASTYFYAEDPALAATVYEQALSFQAGLPPLQLSRIHAELSVVYGQLGRDKEALAAMELAEQLYPRHPEHDPSFLYAEFTRASLTLEQGLSYLALAERLPGREYTQVAADIFARSEQATHTPVPDRIRFEVINHQARTAVLLDDLDAFEVYIGRALDGVVQLDSSQRRKEVHAAWSQASVTWPRERRLATLGANVRTALLAKTV